MRRDLLYVGAACFCAGGVVVWGFRGWYDVHMTFFPARYRLGASEARWLLNGRTR